MYRAYITPLANEIFLLFMGRQTQCRYTYTYTQLLRPAAAEYSRERELREKKCQRSNNPSVASSRAYISRRRYSTYFRSKK